MFSLPDTFAKSFCNNSSIEPGHICMYRKFLLLCQRLAKYIAYMFLMVLANSIRVLRNTGFIHSDDLSTLLLPPAAPGNLGDDAMMTATIEYLREKGTNHLGIIAFGTSDEWRKLHKGIEVVDLGGEYGWKFWRAKLRFLQAMMRFRQFYCLGADMMDGHYSETGVIRTTELVALASRTGVKSAILGFSFNDQPTPGSIQALKCLPIEVKLCARDPISHERLLVHLHRHIDSVADVAFLLDPENDSNIVSIVSNWVEREREASRIIIGVNMNHRLFVRAVDRNLNDFIKYYSSMLVEIYSLNKRISFVIIPHDYRNHSGSCDISISESVFDFLPYEIKEHSMVISEKCRASETKSICKHLDLILSGFMHLAIGALGQGTPAVGIAYQGKFEGLFRHFRLNGMIIKPEEVLKPGHLVNFLMPLIEQRKDIRKHIQAELPRIKQLAQANFG